MADHPTTFKGSAAPTADCAWDDRATIHPARQPVQFPGATTALMHGTFAEMIRHLGALSTQDRQGYVIKKAGDRQYSADEAMMLASHPDFPAQGSG